MADQFVNVTLTEQEMADLADGFDWYQANDAAVIGGYLPTNDNPNPAFSLSVNGETACESWIFWSDIPESVKARLS